MAYQDNESTSSEFYMNTKSVMHSSREQHQRNVSHDQIETYSKEFDFIVNNRKIPQEKDTHKLR